MFACHNIRIYVTIITLLFFCDSSFHQIYFREVYHLKKNALKFLYFKGFQSVSDDDFDGDKSSDGNSELVHIRDF